MIRMIHCYFFFKKLVKRHANLYCYWLLEFLAWAATFRVLDMMTDPNPWWSVVCGVAAISSVEESCSDTIPWRRVAHKKATAEGC